ncbi:hypothetical protein [Brevibacillus dissolubilis]|uniref:hypothetical protein n=1 Tax=Brevibacillus dissolubilis TaxID=1844116 RepID=UPI001117790C|nr:hypothetical protein [Brevibacillus dissolubilis]
MWVFWSDLLTGLFAWWLGRQAQAHYPDTSHLQMNDLAGWTTLILFEPYGLMLSGVFCMGSLYLLLRLIRKQWRLFRVRRHHVGLWGIHAALGLFACFLFVVQVIKFPYLSGLFLITNLVWYVGDIIRVRKARANWAQAKQREAGGG